MGLVEDTQKYIDQKRTVEQPLIQQGFVAGGAIKVTAPGGDKPIRDVTTEVNCCLGTCLLEIIYGIESTFGTNPAANGPKGIAGPNGPFQLDKPTAEQAGLTVSATQDDRLDLAKAATGAAFTIYFVSRILTFAKFGKCDCCTGVLPPVNPFPSACCEDIRKLALIGYNQGSGNLQAALKKTKDAGKDACSFSDVNDQLPNVLSASKLAEVRSYIANYGVIRDKLCS